LKAAINSWIGKIQILPITKGVAQKKVSLGRFSCLAFPLPSYPEQLMIINMWHQESLALDQKYEAATAGIKQAEAQRKNILKDAFSGKLVEQNPSDDPASVLLGKIKSEREARDKLPKSKKYNKVKETANLMKTLSEVLKANGNWIDAQEAFAACGVGNGTDTDRIEELYAELRRLDKAGQLVTKRQGHYDMIKLKDI
jgi:type I restriction enzyme S subunit